MRFAGSPNGEAFLEEAMMKISARNIIPGTLVSVEKGHTTAHVLIDVGGGRTITASITNESVDDMKLAKGQKAYAVIKSSDVMIGID
jgi:molybdopterin-binding protein